MSPALGLLIAVAGYGALLLALAVLVQPARIRLFELGRDMMNRDDWTAVDRNEVRAFLTISRSFWTGMLIPIAALTVVFDVLLRRYKPPIVTKLDHDRTSGEFAAFFALSIFAANPVMVLISVPFVVAAGAAAALNQVSFSFSPILGAIEESFLRASMRVGPTRC